ncbi:hypothetical protein [Sinomicrobium weinanense]|nr:hypothetical protein [Sinomicrobium weinanense]
MKIKERIGWFASKKTVHFVLLILTLAFVLFRIGFEYGRVMAGGA